MPSTPPNLAASVDIQREFADPWRVPKPGTKRPFPVASSDVRRSPLGAENNVAELIIDAELAAANKSAAV